MVRGVQSLAVPANREDHARPNTAGARRGGEAFGVELWVRAGRICVPLEVGPRVTAEAALDLRAQARRLAPGDVAREHAEARLEGGDGVGAGGCVVDGDAAVCVADYVVDHLWYAFEGAVARAEVDAGGPVVGLVLGEGAGGAVGQGGDVGAGHRGVEAVLCEGGCY